MGERERTTMGIPTWRRRFRHLTVEPSMFLMAYSFGVAEAPFQDLLLKKICRKTTDIPYDWCDDLREHPEAESVVHPKAATLLMASDLIETVVPAMASCLAGAWSDRTGNRKPLVVIPLLGFVLKFALLAVIMGITRLPVAYFLFTKVPIILSGGWATFFGAAAAIASDATAGDGTRRTFRLGMLNIIFFAGYVPGSLSASATLQALGHLGVFLLASGACFLAFLSALFAVSDTSTDSSGDQGNIGKKLLTDVVQVFTKRRLKWRRAVLILSLIALVIGIAASNGESNLKFMFGRKEYGWTVMDFTLYRSAAIGSHMAGMLMAFSILSPRMEDAQLAIFCGFGAFLGSLMRVFARKPWMLYCGSFIAMFHGAASPLMRAIMSKCVHQNELAKVFTMTTSLEAAIPLVSQPAYTFLFNSTQDVFPGAFFLLSAAIFFIAIVLCCIIHAINIWCARSEREPLITRIGSTTSIPW